MLVAYKTLIVAPQTNLEYASDEVMQAGNALGAKSLQGKRANVHGLMDILQEGWEIVWFATHGDEQGIYLTDGVLTASEITSLIRSAGVVLTVFNTCSSYEVAHAIHDELKTAFVCTVKKVPDRTAYITGALFAQKIADGLNFFDAYELAKPGQNSTYTFLPAKGPVMPPYDQRRKDDDKDPLITLQEVVNQLEVIVLGSPRYNTVGLIKSNETLGTKIDAMTVKVAQLEANQKVNRRWLITLATICFLLLIAVVTLTYMTGGN